MIRKTVAWDGSGDYRSIQEALDGLENEEDIHLFLRDGTYREKIAIEKRRIFLVGESREGTVLVFGDGAYHIHPDGSAFGTFRSYTLYCHAQNVRIENLTIRNDAGEGEVHGQGIALYMDALVFQVLDTSVYGHQDTLFTAPLPEQPILPGSFVGPGENRVRRPSTGVFSNCHISGDIDFIFGGADVLFEGCTLESLDNGKGQVNYIAAPCTQSGGIGFVFRDSRFISASRQKMTYLARPWRKDARAAFLGCTFGEHLLPGAFDNWGETANEESAKFALFPEGYFKREELNFGKTLFSEEIIVYDRIVKEILREVKKGWKRNYELD